MFCKYCHFKTHIIDNCPTIICKICNGVGHPQWLCKMATDNKRKKTNYPPSYPPNYPPSYPTNYPPKKGEEIVVKNEKKEEETQKKMDYYLKRVNLQWGGEVEMEAPM